MLYVIFHILIYKIYDYVTHDVRRNSNQATDILTESCIKKRYVNY